MIDQLYLVVTICDTRYAILADAVVGIADFSTMTPVPGAPRHILGIGAQRSHLVTLIDVCDRRGHEAVQLPVRSVVVSCNGFEYGLVVDRDIENLTSKAPLLPPPPGLDSGRLLRISGIVELGGAYVPLIDLAASVSQSTAAHQRHEPALQKAFA